MEEYLEQQKLYETFESLMKSLITQKPADPIDHLIKKLEQPESKSCLLLNMVELTNRPLLCLYSVENCFVETSRQPWQGNCTFIS